MSNQIDRFGRIAYNKNRELSQASLDVRKDGDGDDDDDEEEKGEPRQEPAEMVDQRLIREDPAPKK